MKQRRTPTEKKALSYAKDRVLGVKYPKAFRRYWPRRKAAANQKERRQVRQLLDVLTPQNLTNARIDFPTKPVKRDQVQKWPDSSVALGQAVAGRKRMRVYRTAWNFFKTPYTPEKHRDNFVLFLEELTKQQTEYNQEVSQLFLELIEPPDPIDGKFTSRMDRRSLWLHAFLDDVPVWRKKLASWIKNNSV